MGALERACGGIRLENNPVLFISLFSECRGLLWDDLILVGTHQGWTWADTMEAPETLVKPLTKWTVCVCVLCVLVTQLCLILYDPMDYRPPGSSVHGIRQARILEWVATPFSSGSSRHRDRTEVSCMAGRFFILWATREAPNEQ